MKLIHTADLHLGSGLESNLPAELARKRRDELYLTFSRMVDYASQSGVEVFLIAGDLFDTATPGRELWSRVMRTVCDHPSIRFFCIEGNHDRETLCPEPENIPAHFVWIGKEWSSFDLGEVVLWGSSAALEVPLPEMDASRVNVVMLHGQLTAGSAAGVPDALPENLLTHRGIDYLALGHLHSFSQGMLDDRCRYSYPGCPEGRGFDECGEKGFVLLETTGRRSQPLETHFVPFSQRQLYTVEVSLTGCDSESTLLRLTDDAVAGIPHPSDSMLKVELTGDYQPEWQKDTVFLRAVLSERFWFVKIKDRSRMCLTEADVAGDVSLRGEFLRLLTESGEEEEDVALIAEMGLRALKGENLDI